MCVRFARGVACLGNPGGVKLIASTRTLFGLTAERDAFVTSC